MEHLDEKIRYITAVETFIEKMRSNNITMPIMSFPEGMLVEPLLPFMGVACRFRLNGYSVYLDVFSNLGNFDNKPYWEVYDGEDCHRFAMEDWKDMLDFVVNLTKMGAK